MTTKESLGICIGSASISYVLAREEDGHIAILEHEHFPHKGNPREVAGRLIKGVDMTKTAIVVTGKGFKDILETHAISEAEAVERAARHLGYAGKFGAVASLGAETFMVYTLGGDGYIRDIITGNKCASGTGEFFLQQIRRMDLTVEEAVKLALKNDPHPVSGRCSVFCKSDCTHALNKGVRKGEVVSGLCKMIAGKVNDLLRQQASENVLVIGGVSKNRSVVGYLKDFYPSLLCPQEGPYFEAFGAAIAGLSLEPRAVSFKGRRSGFTYHQPISAAARRVTFKEVSKGTAEEGDTCILGLDVGSTTTKAVLIRRKDNAILASSYLRTNGNPIGASVACYEAVRGQVGAKVNIEGLGVTGSGRHIAGIHAMTTGVINEIIAHATAAFFFDPDVDTIFEIGGQDAKYTYLTNGIASDYAMNEACSAGTGSFLEESAKESLGIDYREISGIAMASQRPPNFSDQCAAFISSDIKTAHQEGIKKEDIVAGLVFSICLNYVNRVKGNRPTGKKVFMQGGVCYNRSVPIAMAALIGKDIVVPPEPGLMGAFGVALEIVKRLDLGLMEAQEFDLDDLIGRTFEYKKRFLCAGGNEGCDLGCEINVIEVAGKKYPFGGACSRYYNQRLNITSQATNYVEKRQDLIFTVPSPPQGQRKKVGILKSFLANSFYQLYHHFFSVLGLEPVLSDTVKKEGMARIRSSFCYPVEISHGLMQDLVDKDVDYIFIPHVTELRNDHESTYKRACVFVQGEPYYLASAFEGIRQEILSPVIDFSKGEDAVRKVFASLAKRLGFSEKKGLDAFDAANHKQREVEAKLRELGKEALRELEADPTKTGIVLFGRPYNAFAKEANMGIPRKFSTKGAIIIPHDLLPTHDHHSNRHMYWYWGQVNLRNARYVAKHPQLYGTFITNFSCGPDSFILSYFRKIMGMKPSLTLELDSHSSDAGVETRIDAALDIIRGYRELSKAGMIETKKIKFTPLEVNSGTRIGIVSLGKTYPLTSPDVELIIPSMGRFGTQAFAATFRSLGINAVGLGVPTEETLQYGRAHSTCKECLPFILTTGSMVEYLEKHRKEGRKYLFFMPYGSGPCRQGQYHVRLQDIIESLGYEDASVLSLNDENAYGGLGLDFTLKAWIAMIISDGVSDIENALLALSRDPKNALDSLEKEWLKVVKAIESGRVNTIFSQLKEFSSAMVKIPLRERYADAKKISLIGEAYVRKEEFSRVDLIETLAKEGFVVKVAPISEYIYYVNYLARKGYRKAKGKELDSFKDKAVFAIQYRIQRAIDTRIRSILARSGLYDTHFHDIETTLEHSQDLISRELLGEAVLTVGLGLREIVDSSCGVITLGPFACMPSRLSEALLSKEFSKGKKGFATLPYLNIETDGKTYPQLIKSRIEVFMLQAGRLHKEINS